MLIKIAASATRTQAGFEACMFAPAEDGPNIFMLCVQVRFLKSSNLRLVSLFKRYNSCTMGFVVACSVFTLLAPIYIAPRSLTRLQESGSADFFPILLLRLNLVDSKNHGFRAIHGLVFFFLPLSLNSLLLVEGLLCFLPIEFLVPFPWLLDARRPSNTVD